MYSLNLRVQTAITNSGSVEHRTTTQIGSCAAVSSAANHPQEGSSESAVMPQALLSAATPCTSQRVSLPASGWFSGKAMIMEKGFKVTRAFIYDYFVERHTNNCPTNNFRALKTGYNLFASGHVQSVQMATVGNYIFYKSKILPSMKKDKYYNSDCCIDVSKKKIVAAHCSCPVGVCESCVHVSALLHSLECLFESSKNSRLVASAVGESRTSQECSWLKPRLKKVAATCATDIVYIKHEYGRKKQKNPPPANFDPRPPSKRNQASVAESRRRLCESIKGSGICADLILNN